MSQPLASCPTTPAAFLFARSAVSPGQEAIVVQALGWGNMNIPMYEAVQEAIAKNVVVVVSTRVPNGRVLPVYGFQDPHHACDADHLEARGAAEVLRQVTEAGRKRACTGGAAGEVAPLFSCAGRGGRALKIGEKGT
ncbi:MAG: hypothetical protein ACM3L8_06395 [Verrucomicrobiota bacterium]